jgi:rare lipoprotein A
VDVEIIDRGPFIDGRIIDLSHRAAQEVAMIGPGTARVRIEIIEAPPGPVPAVAHFSVQVAAYSNKTTADQLQKEMAARYGFAKLVPRTGNVVMWRVLVGDESTEDAAHALAERIRNEGGEKGASYVVRLDTIQ